MGTENVDDRNEEYPPCWPEKCRPKFSHSRVVTGDKTWVYCNDLESKVQSMKRKYAGSPVTKISGSRSHQEKTTAVVFWGSDGMIHVDYFPRYTTVNELHNAELLSRLRESVKEKRRAKIRHGALLHQDNVCMHTSQIALCTVRDCRSELLPYLP